jgi:hypothetical protein
VLEVVVLRVRILANLGWGLVPKKRIADFSQQEFSRLGMLTGFYTELWAIGQHKFVENSPF